MEAISPTQLFSQSEGKGTIERMKLFLLCLSLQAFAQYSLKDLEFLENERNYGEFFQHAQDIRPVERGEAWQNMLKTMSRSYLLKYLTLNIYRQEDYQVLLKLSSWPTLQRDLKFQELRAQFGQGYFTQCFRQGPSKNQCLQQLSFYFNQGMKLPQESLAYLQLLGKQRPPFAYRSFPYIKSILKDPLKAQHCSHPLVREGLFQELIKIQYPHFHALKTWAQDKIGPSCLDRLAQELRLDLWSADFSRALLAFDLLYVRKKISPRDQDFFLIRNYLHSSRKGEHLNLSWNTLKALARDFERRKKVLNQLKTLDPLPDHLFGLGPSQKKNTLIHHLAKNFPEYLGHYSHTCLRYLQGQGSFPNGNPTIYCRQIMEEAQAKNWIDRQRLSLYQKVKIPQ